MSEPTTEHATPSVPVVLLQQTIGALQGTSTAVAEVKAEVVASRDASALRAVETNGKVDKLTDVAAETNKIIARLATVLEKIENRHEAAAAKVLDAGTAVEVDKLHADGEKQKARAAVWAAVAKAAPWLLTAGLAWYAQQHSGDTTTTTATTTTITTPVTDAPK